MTAARLVPIYFPGRDDDFDKQVTNLKTLLADDAEILEPVALGSRLPAADAALFPQVLGDAYRMVDAIRAIDIPRLVVTSEFGTMSMWDWEIGSYLRAEGIATISPYSLDQTRKICRALAVKRELRNTRFLVFQDNPGEGFQPRSSSASTGGRTNAHSGCLTASVSPSSRRAIESWPPQLRRLPIVKLTLYGMCGGPD
jgi:hypothetical protein